MGRVFRIRERMNFQIRAEFTNILAAESQFDELRRDDDHVPDHRSSQRRVRGSAAPPKWGWIDPSGRHDGRTVHVLRNDSGAMIASGAMI